MVIQPIHPLSAKILLQMEDVAQSIKNLRHQLRLTQSELANHLGVTRSALASYESGRNQPPKSIVGELKKMGLAADVGLPRVPAPELEIPVVSIGYIAASSPAGWTDPFDVEEFEYIPSHMGDTRGRFTCKVASDSMMPLLQPDDVCVMQRSDVPKIGAVILFRSLDNQITLKQLKHDGAKYILHPLNPSYADCEALGMSVGYLVGIIRKVGKRTITDYDPDGIRP